MRGPIEAGANGWELEFQPQGALSWEVACAMAGFGLVVPGDGPEAGPEAGPDRAWAFSKRRGWKLVPNGNRMWRRRKRSALVHTQGGRAVGSEPGTSPMGARQRRWHKIDRGW